MFGILDTLACRHLYIRQQYEVHELPSSLHPHTGIVKLCFLTQIKLVSVLTVVTYRKKQEGEKSHENNVNVL